jgi:hypothetical protein
MDPDPDPGGPKTYGSDGSRFGSGSATLPIYKEIQIRAVAMSYMSKGFLIYEEMRKYLVIYEEAISHI